ncbi:MAG: PorP/SprF family type IX secretion system membrane protein [Cyclobacteriaceae bacterium]
MSKRMAHSNIYSLSLQLLMIASLLFITCAAHAQDLFFNQFQLAPLATNPGQPGVMQEAQVAINYRNVPVGAGETFNTSQLSAFYPMGFGKHQFVFSGSFYQERISEFFTTTGATLGAALSIAITEKSELSFGTQATLFGTQIQEDFTTDSQFINGVFIPTAASGEISNFTSGNAISASSGLYWQLRGDSEVTKAFAGISLFNFTQPDRAVTEGFADEPSVTYKATLGYEVFRRKGFAIFPSALAISRRGQQWLQAGGLLTYDLIQQDQSTKQIGFGGWYNTNESVMLSLQYQQHNLAVAFSFNLPSGDDLAIARDGVFEIALNYRISKRKEGLTKAIKE